MNRDPFYLKIVERLSGPLDPELFERCAAALLRDEWPTLAPVRGGGDAGVDGAVGRPDGPAFALVCTTAKDVLENLRRSLKSQLAGGLPAGPVISATSQQLTATRKANLAAEARTQGFDLLHVYDQAAFADRLYRNPAWCRELLNLTGDPPAIAAVPISRRPPASGGLVGRDADAAWLLGATGDRLLVGQPGSGKTALLQILVDEGRGGYLVDADPGRIAAAVREQEPGVVIVDDAHVDPGVVERLRQLRAQLGAGFAIAAASWPGGAGAMQAALGIGDAATHELPLLTRDELVAVVRAAGLAGPDGLVGGIVDQARGRPGLAATLARLCLVGGVREVVLGEALNRDVRAQMGPVVGERGIQLLACFGLGGDSGMAAEGVSEALRLGMLDVSVPVTELGYAGIVEERGRGADARIAVVPEALRDALVRDVFFNSPGRLPTKALLAVAPSKADAARALVGAVACGARMPREELRAVLEEADSTGAWEAYAWLGSGEAAWVVDFHPELVPMLADAVLENAPERALPVLFGLAAGDDRPPRQHPDHPLRKIGGWVEGVEPGTAVGPARRERLMAAAERWRGAGGEARVASRAVALALSPRFEINSVDPGAGNTFRWSAGPLAEGELRRVAALWPRALALLRAASDADWPAVFDLVRQWAYADGTATGVVPPTTEELKRGVGGTMLRDLAGMPDMPGVAYRARRTAADLGLDPDAEPDDWDLLYPAYPRRSDTDWQTDRDRAMQAIRELADRWSGEKAAAVAARFAALEGDAHAAGLADGGPRLTPELATELANRVGPVDEWLAAMMDFGAPPDVVAPFLRRAVAAGSERAGELLGLAAARPDLRRAAVFAVAFCPDASDASWDAVWTLLPGAADVVHAAAERGMLAGGTLGRLLGCESPAVATAAALGEWRASPRGTVRKDLHAVWRTAIVRTAEFGDDLAEILEDDAGLATDWIGARLDGREYLYVGPGDLLGRVLDGLDADARRRVFGSLGGHSTVFGNVVARLVGDDAALYREVLADDRLQAFHLAPLEWKPRGAWRDRVVAAGEHGYSAESVAAAVFGLGPSWSGPASAYWADWVDAFVPYLADENPFVRTVAERATANASSRRNDALARERREAVWGRG